MKPEDVYPAHQGCLRDESGLEGDARAIAFCQSAEDIAATLRESDGPVTVQGARTGLAGGAVPQGGLILNLTHMDRVLGMRWEGGDCYLHVQAGATLAAMQAEANAAGRLFPADPTEQTATAGGLFATGATGPSSLALGSASSYVQALCWATPQGALWRMARGQYRFDNEGCPLPDGTRLLCRTDLPQTPLWAGIPRPGMDLIDFLAGSEGRLGVAAELEWRLPEKPVEHWGIVHFFGRQADALCFAGALRPAGGARADGVWAAEFLDEGALRLLAAAKESSPLLRPLPSFPALAACAVYVELCGRSEAVMEGLLLDQLALFSLHGGRDEDSWAQSGAGVQKLRDLRHAVPELAGTACPAVRCEADFAGPPDQAAQYIRMYQQGMAQAGLEGMVYGHVLQNRLHAALLPQNEQQRQSCAELMRVWAARVARDGGLIAYENGIGRLREELVRAYLPPEARAHFAVLGRFFDPQGRMAGGVFR